MRKRLASVGLLAVLVAAPAAGELYRWTDARGNTHYTSDIHQVPADQRELARRTVPKGSLQRVGAPTSPAPAAPASPRTDAEDLVGGKSELAWRDEAIRLRARVAQAAAPAERCKGVRERQDAGPGGGAIPEETAEASRCDRAVRDLALAQQKLDDFEESAQRLGVPPGWIRE